MVEDDGKEGDYFGTPIVDFGAFTERVQFSSGSLTRWCAKTNIRCAKISFSERAQGNTTITKSIR